MVDRRAILACLVVAALLLAGCSGKKPKTIDSDGDGVPDKQDPTPDGGTLPDGLTYKQGYVGPDGGYIEGDQVSFFCQSFANSTVAIDQNRTLSGSQHSHDMWGGEDSKVIFEGDLPEDGFDAGWFLMPGAVVHPGAGRMEFTLSWEPKFEGDWRQLGVAQPGLGNTGPDHFLNFTEPGQTLGVDFNFTANDRPHAEKTGWEFKMIPYNAYGNDIASDSDPAGQQTVERTFNDAVSDLAATITWTIFRVYDCLPVDPPHYDYWNGTTDRLVFEERTTHDYQHTGGVGATQDPFRGFQYTLKGLPDNGTIPPGTATVVVRLTWDGDEASLVPLGLEYVGADQDADSTKAVWARPAPSTTGTNTREWVISVHPLETDGPYAEKSRWDFRWFLDNPGDDDPPGQGIGRFKGTVDWVVTAYREGYAP